MNYAAIKKTDVANGPGIRVSLFVSGCTHGCKGCFNKEAWDFHYGIPYTEDTKEEIITALAPSYIRGLSILGGEPMEPANRSSVLALLEEVRRQYPHKDIWCYTGYTYETDLLSSDGRARCEVTKDFLSYIDILVDGEFIQEQYDISLKFRGSKNQRILQIQKEGCPQLFSI